MSFDNRTETAFTEKRKSALDKTVAENAQFSQEDDDSAKDKLEHIQKLRRFEKLLKHNGSDGSDGDGNFELEPEL